MPAPQTAPAPNPTSSSGLWAPLALYLLCVAVLCKLYLYILGPDTISYISIARHYFAGRWGEAVNTNWNPLFSWLLVPLMAAHVPELAALKVLGCMSGVLTLYGVVLLSRHFELSGCLLRVTLYSAVVMIASYALAMPGPDLLVAGLLLLYFYLIFQDEGLSAKRGALCGVLGALAYYSKGYAFYFFLAHFPAVCFAHWLGGSGAVRRHAVRQLGAGLAVFGAVCAPWLALMSARQGGPSTGTTGAWNYRLAGPDAAGYPQYRRLIPPAREHGISMWEEPSPALLPAWSPWQSGRMLRQELKLIAANGKAVARYFFEFSFLSAALLLGCAALGLSGPAAVRRRWLLPLFTMLLYAAGYVLVIVQDRYFWSSALLLLVAGAAVLRRLLAAATLPAAGRVLLLAAFSVSFIEVPVHTLLGWRNVGRSLWQMSQTIRARYPMQGKVAGCARWNDSLSLSYYLGLQFYSNTGCTVEEAENGRQLNPSLPPQQVVSGTAADEARAARELQQYGVDYYFAWSTCPWVPQYVAAHEEITAGRLENLRIFRLK